MDKNEAYEKLIAWLKKMGYSGSIRLMDSQKRGAHAWGFWPVGGGFFIIRDDGFANDNYNTFGPGTGWYNSEGESVREEDIP
ncbi:MAG: hypothetical protein A2919_01110 [Candidatus Spechtbacteria bacterium RIFCSPLOWO2_01_FULL_43_12]|uniref:Immunity protein 35 domain-containing protein n=1 Tax=Candidatus Spechtbacteria bacterium RIFCSPLOWO2_01_FULL_43_12 TaxID=1802162 RepID=A0A1G2HFQ7_9BACT|nr:MAG: hypothetical protein A2919_01110 [Candidatus Spechtbacteria bacterium RIFCSPLOWO2_01_FULL_43_12]